ncbi:MAG: hypothetical protein JWR04_1852 [Rhodoglobus sp.]|nr:hypothetical protein [Rhodoglobus sp.]
MTVRLTEVQRLATSGARAVETFEADGRRYLAVPQLAYDAPGTPPGINGGTSNTDVLLFVHDGSDFVPHGTLPGVGGEDVESFTIDGRLFLAVASIRMGSGPYNFRLGSPIYEWVDGAFVPFQSALTTAAKQWRHWEVDGAHFLGVAQGHPADPGLSSAILRWDGAGFAPFQQLESVAGYNLYAFELDGEHYLAHADHALPSRLYRWDGTRYVEHQDLVERGGRAFLLVDLALLVAKIDGDSFVLRWDGSHFQPHDTLAGGAGGREFARVGEHVVRVNFIRGTPAEPVPDLMSYVYRAPELQLVHEFPTTGGTDATAFALGGAQYLVVSHGLASAASAATFTAECIVYRVDEGEV